MKFIPSTNPLEFRKELPVRRVQIFISVWAAWILALCALVQYVLLHRSIPPDESPVSPAKAQPAKLK